MSWWTGSVGKRNVSAVTLSAGLEAWVLMIGRVSLQKESTGLPTDIGSNTYHPK